MEQGKNIDENEIFQKVVKPFNYTLFAGKYWSLQQEIQLIGSEIYLHSSLSILSIFRQPIFKEYLQTLYYISKYKLFLSNKSF